MLSHFCALCCFKIVCLIFLVISGWIVFRLNGRLGEAFHCDEVHAHCFARSTQMEGAKLQVSNCKAYNKVLHLE
jgi:hypothetical protein